MGRGRARRTRKAVWDKEAGFSARLPAWRWRQTYWPGDGKTPSLIIKTLLDGNVIALNADTSQLYWKVENSDYKVGSTLTVAPHVFKDVVLIGSSGAELGVRGYMTAYDVRTGEQKWRAYTGSFSNLERLLAKWRNLKCETVKATSAVPNSRPVDPASGRSISPIVAAALCIKPRELLTANQAAKVDAMKKDWPEFATMRQLAMRFRGMLKSKSVSKLGGWLKDAQKSACMRCNVSLARRRETSTQ